MQGVTLGLKKGQGRTVVWVEPVFFSLLCQFQRHLLYPRGQRTFTVPASPRVSSLQGWRLARGWEVVLETHYIMEYGGSYV
jgi:hypothetical protein